MNITPQQLLTICPKLGASVGIWTAALNPAMTWANIDTKARMAAFISQCAHESAEFTVLIENLNYSEQALLSKFAKYFNAATAKQYARNPQRIANRVYANRMGNGDEASGDGWRNRGRGPIQLTGAKNLQAFSLAAYNDSRVSDNPDLLLDPKVGAMGAAWFWLENGLNPLADAGQFQAITKRINGGLHGLDSRLAYHRVAISIL